MNGLSVITDEDETKVKNDEIIIITVEDFWQTGTKFNL